MASAWITRNRYANGWPDKIFIHAEATDGENGPPFTGKVNLYFRKGADNKTDQQLFADPDQRQPFQAEFKDGKWEYGPTDQFKAWADAGFNILLIGDRKIQLTLDKATRELKPGSASGKNTTGKEVQVFVHRKQDNTLQMQVLAPGLDGLHEIKGGYGKDIPLFASVKDPQDSSKPLFIEISNGVGTLTDLPPKTFGEFTTVGVMILKDEKFLSDSKDVPAQNIPQPYTGERILIDNANQQGVICCDMFKGTIIFSTFDEHGKKITQPVSAKSNWNVDFSNESSHQPIAKKTSVALFDSERDGSAQLGVDFLDCMEKEVEIKLSVPGMSKPKTIKLKYKQL